MKIIGFNLTSIHVDRKDNIDQSVQITQNVDIKDLSEEPVPIANTTALKLSFNLVVKYSNDMAQLEMGGNILILPDESEEKKLKASWKEKKIPEDMKVPLFNFIMNKCNVKALHIEDEMNMPLHVPMPRLSNDPKENK